MLGLMDIQAGSGHRADPPGVCPAPSPAHTAWHRAGHGDSTRTLLHPSRRDTGPSAGALAEAEAALASGAGFAVLDPREFGDFCVDWETAWWQCLVRVPQRDSPACIDSGGSRDTSPTVGTAGTAGAPAPSTGLAESPDQRPGLCPAVPRPGDTLGTLETAPPRLPSLTVGVQLLTRPEVEIWKSPPTSSPSRDTPSLGAALPAELRAARGSTCS